MNHMADKALRFLAAAAALAVVSLANTGLAGNSGTRSIADSYGTATTPALRLPSSSAGSAAVDLWKDPAEAPASANCPYGETDCRCGADARSNWCSPSWYGQADMLIWWFKGNNVPPLVTRSPNGTPRVDAGVLGRPNTEILFGDTGIDDNYRPGLRLTVGRWLDDCQINGLEVTWFSVGDGANSGNFYAESVGSPADPILARPFYDVLLEEQGSQLVAFTDPELGDLVAGNVRTQTNSEMHSLAVLLRHNLSQDCSRRFDLVGGYRYLRFRESLAIREFLVSRNRGGGVAVGTTFDVLDDFNAENDFHGGEIGFDTLIRRGSWDLDILTKVALGNMREVASISGQTIITAPTQTPLVRQGGLLALQGTNMGTYSWNEFAMIPELNLNLRYHYNECLSLTLGYSLLWITDIARTGDQIDMNVNTSYLPGGITTPAGPLYPAPLYGHSDMWVQGLNLGVVWEY
jgi:hypothetical protein